MPPGCENTTVANVLDKDGNLVGSYDSIDKAIQEADGATTLTIEGVASTTKKQDAEGNVVETTEKPKLIFEDKGIALWSKSPPSRIWWVLK